MAYDIQLESLCDHRVHREIYLLDYASYEDGKSVRLIQPISDGNVKLWYNNVPVPQNHPAFGWTLEIDELSASIDPKHKIQFKNAIRDLNGIFEVSYSVRIDLCRKCFGVGILWDHPTDPTGRLRTVTRQQKLQQSLLKYILQRVNSNPFFPFIGTNIPNMINQKVVDIDAMREQIVLDVTIAVQALKEQQNAHWVVFRYGAEEMVDRLINVEVLVDPEDPRAFAISMVVSSMAGTAFSFDRQFYLTDRFVSIPVPSAGV